MASTKHGDSSSSGANDNAAKEAPSEQEPAANPQPLTENGDLFLLGTKPGQQSKGYQVKLWMEEEQKKVREYEEWKGRMLRTEQPWSLS